MPTYTTQYPPAHSGTYVKATTTRAVEFYPHFNTDPALSLTGTSNETSWASTNGIDTNQRFHIDLGSAKIIRRIYYENYHHIGNPFGAGMKNFTFWGSNNAAAFAELTYATDTNWTVLTVATNVMLEHVALDQADPQYIIVTNAVAYRYYAFKFADNYGGDTRISGRHIELQTEDAAGITWNGITITKFNGITITIPINTQ